VSLFGSSNTKNAAGLRSVCEERFVRLGCVVVVMVALAALGAVASPQQTGQAAPEPEFKLGAITPYLGLLIDGVEFPGLSSEEGARLQAITQLKNGDPLTREALHEAMLALFATGRFADIQAEAEHTGIGVLIRFLTSANYFVGQLNSEGVNINPSANQLATATRLQLGELYTPDKLDRALAGITRVLEENGFHRARVTPSEQKDDAEHQVNLTFHVTLGARATVGKIVLDGEAGYPEEEIIGETGKFHTGDPVTSGRLTRALQRIRARYQKQGRLLAQVSVANRDYQPDRNTVDYEFKIDRGPVVRIEAEGFKVSHARLRKLVPIYEEGAVDADLLNEGRRNLQNYLQTLGYFNNTVAVSQHVVEEGRALEVVYAIDPGDRSKLAALRISGNKLFSEDQIRARMQCQTAGRLFSHGRYSESLLQEDVGRIQDLYRANGYRQVEVTSKLINGFENDPSQLAINVVIKEGPQTRVAWVRLSGEYTLQPEQLLPSIQTQEGQGFNESSLADDRDTILEKYYNNGFTNATVDVSYLAVNPSPEGLPQVGVTFTINEGEQFFVSQVFFDGLHFTRLGVARRETQVQPGEPLSQRDMLETQRRLYGLGLFNQVDTAIQNPDGSEPRKNVLVSMHEAKRYTFDYGVGFEFQTGQPSVGTNQPLGQTGVSPRVSFGVTRIDVGGRHQTITAKSNVSRLQQRGLVSFDAPKLMNRDLRFTATGFYDNTIDVSTFTSERLEGSIQTLQVLKREAQTERELTTMAYRFSYRRVKASNIQVTSNLIPLLSRPTRVGSPSFTYIRNRRDDDLETTHGSYTTVEGSVASNYFGSEADFSRALIKNSTYYTLFRNRSTGKGFVFARSTSVGLENPFGGTVVLDPSQTPPGSTLPAGQSLIPLPERFFTGGGNSHRGFGLNQAGPRDSLTGFPLGGSALFVNNLELRLPNVVLPYLMDSVGFTVFHDMGNVFAKPQEMLPSIGRWHQPDPDLCKQESTHAECNYNYVSHAIGLGVRYQTPIGPLRFDFGYNLNPPYFPSYTNIVTNSVNGQVTGTFGYQRAGRFNFSFSVGQSF
jgi:outer membrane protein assembly complex protein YaeT